MENGNKKILWLIAVVNILTLILLTGFIVMSWDVITTGKTSQQETTTSSNPTPNVTGTLTQQTPQATGTPSGQQTDVVKCMQDCLKGGEQASECESKCGASKQSPTGGTTQGKCGDGVCDTVEKANPNLCPEDCK